MPKHPMQIHRLCRDSQKQPLTHGAVFFPPQKKPCSSPTSKRYTDACHTDLQCSLPGITFEAVTSMLFSHLASCFHTERPHSPEVWVAQTLYISHASLMHPYPLILEAADSTSTRALVSNPLLAELHITSTRNLLGKYLSPQHNTVADNTKVACRNLILFSLGPSLLICNHNL